MPASRLWSISASLIGVRVPSKLRASAVASNAGSSESGPSSDFCNGCLKALHQLDATNAPPVSEGNSAST